MLNHEARLTTPFVCGTRFSRMVTTVGRSLDYKLHAETRNGSCNFISTSEKGVV